MKHKAVGTFVGLCVLAGLVALLALPAGMVDALMQSTPVPVGDRGGSGGGSAAQATPTTGGLGGFAIPTVTPGGGLTEGIGQATPTPAGDTPEPETGGLPALTDADLEALNLAPEDVPAAFAANRAVEEYAVSAIIEQIRPSAPELADMIQALSDEYGWSGSIGVRYTACDPALPVSDIYSEIGQLGGPDLARAFIDDPRVGALYETLGYAVTGTELPVHGMVTSTSNEPTTCFDAETEYNLNFDYQGLLIAVSLTVNSQTDRALVENLFGQLAPVLVAKVDALSDTPFDPTPGAPSTEAATETPTEIALEPTATEAPAVTTAPPATPKPTTQAGLLFGATNTPGAGSSDPVLQQIDAIMPTIEELALPQPPFNLNEGESGIFSLDEMVADFEASGLTELAPAIQQAGTANNLLGQVMRIWDTGDECPDTAGLSIESDVSVFPSAAEAQAYLADEGIRQAWLNTGFFNTYEISGGTATARGSLAIDCGPVTLYGQIINSGRFNITALVIAYSTASEADMESVVDTLNQFVAQKLAGAGIE